MSLSEFLPKNLAAADPGTAERRFVSVEAAKASWVRQDVPDSVVKQMLDTAVYFNLEFGEDLSDIFAIPEDQTRKAWSVYTKWAGIARVLRYSGLWLPGVSTLSMVGPNLIAHATCHVRVSVDSPAWVEVGSHATYANYYDRDVNLPIATKQDPQGEWIYKGDEILEEIAQYRAAAKALPNLVANFNYLYQVPRSETHHYVQARKPAG